MNLRFPQLCLIAILMIGCSKNKDDLQNEITNDYKSAMKYPDYFEVVSIDISDREENLWSNWQAYEKLVKEIEDCAAGKSLLCDRNKTRQEYLIELEELKKNKKLGIYKDEFDKGYTYTIRYKFKNPSTGNIDEMKTGGMIVNYRSSRWRTIDSTGINTF